MNQALAKNLRCILLRDGVEIWVEKERIENININNVPKFIRIDDELFNSVEIIGIFTPQTMEARTRRKNGEWKCEKGNWHSKGKQCECSPIKNGKMFIKGQGWI